MSRPFRLFRLHRVTAATPPAPRGATPHPAGPPVSWRDHRAALLIAGLWSVLLLLAVWLPEVTQPAHLHDYADQRTLWGVPRALDVLSNLPFAVMGLWGLLCLSRIPADRLDAAQRGLATVFGAGLVATAAGSGWYHFRPDDLGLAIDRLGMAVAFVGVLGLAAAGRVGPRSGWAMAASVAVASAVGIGVCLWSGNVLPWSMVQGVGVAVLLAAAGSQPRPGALTVPWLWVVALYAVAKGLELADHPLFDVTQQMLSGHTLKHVAAAAATLPVVLALARLGQNAPTVQPAAAN